MGLLKIGIAEIMIEIGIMGFQSNPNWDFQITALPIVMISHLLMSRLCLIKVQESFHEFCNQIVLQPIGCRKDYENNQKFTHNVLYLQNISRVKYFTIHYFQVLKESISLTKAIKTRLELEEEFPCSILSLSYDITKRKY